jgi:hypothetical protein
MPELDLSPTGLFHIVNEEYRVTAVTEFIRNHKGCTAQEIVDGQKVNGREKVFKILKELKKVKMVSEEKDEKDRRKKKLFLANDHPLVSVPSELNNFETNFMQLVQKSMREFKIRYQSIILRRWSPNYRIYINLCASPYIYFKIFPTSLIYRLSIHGHRFEMRVH